MVLAPGLTQKYQFNVVLPLTSSMDSGLYIYVCVCVCLVSVCLGLCLSTCVCACVNISLFACLNFPAGGNEFIFLEMSQRMIPVRIILV